MQLPTSNTEVASAEQLVKLIAEWLRAEFASTSATVELSVTIRNGEPPQIRLIGYVPEQWSVRLAIPDEIPESIAARAAKDSVAHRTQLHEKLSIAAHRRHLV
jgi:hypothetical protein